MRKDIKTLTVLAIFLVVLTVAFSDCHPRNLPIFKQVAEKLDEQAIQEVRRLIVEVPEYKELNRVCQEIPLPNDFDLVVMKASIREIGITYFTSQKQVSTRRKGIFVNTFQIINGKSWTVQTLLEPTGFQKEIIES